MSRTDLQSQLNAYLKELTLSLPTRNFRDKKQFRRHVIRRLLRRAQDIKAEMNTLAVTEAHRRNSPGEDPQIVVIQITDMHVERVWTSPGVLAIVVGSDGSRPPDEMSYVELPTTNHICRMPKRIIGRILNAINWKTSRHEVLAYLSEKLCQKNRT